MLDGGCFFARYAAGVSWSTLSSDCTASVARRSSVMKRRPLPWSGGRASLLKSPVGTSTVAAVSGTEYFCQPSGSADADAHPGARQAIISVVRMFGPPVSLFGSQPRVIGNVPKNRGNDLLLLPRPALAGRGSG